MHHPDLFDCAPSGTETAAIAVAAPEAVPEARSLKGRRAVHADSAARKRAHRSKLARIDFTDKPEIRETIAEIAEALGCSRNEVLQSMARFALTNRNWKQVGLYGSKGQR